MGKRNKRINRENIHAGRASFEKEALPAPLPRKL
jgi:hypothetical protein